MAFLLNQTEIWKSRKSAFLDRYNGNAFLASTIKRIERNLPDVELPVCPYNFYINFYSDATHIQQAIYARLACLYVVKIDTLEIAPCQLFFPLIDATEIKNYAELVKPVMEGLGWKPPLYG